MTHLRPVLVGMGFSKKTDAHSLKKNLDSFLQTHQYTLKALALPAFKQQDENIIQLCNLVSAPIHYINDQILKNLQPQCQSYSPITAKHTGLGSIAEACVLALIDTNDYLLIPKIIYNRVTFSIAIKGDPS